MKCPSQRRAHRSEQEDEENGMGLPPLAPFVYLGQYRLRCYVTVCRVWSLTLYDYIIVMIYFCICLCPFSGFLHHDKMYLLPYTLYLSFVKDILTKYTISMHRHVFLVQHYSVD